MKPPASLRSMIPLSLASQYARAERIRSRRLERRSRMLAIVEDLLDLGGLLLGLYLAYCLYAFTR